MEKSCNPSSGNSKPSTNTAAQATAAATGSTSGGNSTNSSGSGSGSGNSGAVQNALRQLNKGSYKISKPTSKHRSVGGGGDGDSSNPNSNKPPPPPLPPPAAAANSQQPLPQPPVYNINKNDFREVVQKLTGSPAHQTRLSSLPGAPPRENPRPAAPPAGGAASTRLQKIRPPPLAQLTPHPPPPMAPAGVGADPLPAVAAGLVGGSAWPRSSPLSPLPPFPTVSAAAESPISAYMRYLQSGSLSAQQALIPSPGGGSTAAPLLPLAPPSPLAFGCMPSPRSAYQMMLSPGLLFPPSPGVPMPSPRWRDQ